MNHQNRTRAVAEADLQHLISRRRMRPIDALTPDERRTRIWGDDYDAGVHRNRLVNAGNVRHASCKPIRFREIGSDEMSA